jgi:hypothetical protein
MRQAISPSQDASGAGSIYPPRIQALLLLLARIISGQAQPALGALDPATLAALREHGLTPWLYGEAAQQGWGKYCPGSIWAALRQDYLASLNTTRIQQARIIEIVKAFCQAGLEIILLKGADLQHRLYGNPEVRPMEDLDVLVSREDLSRAAPALAGIGYQLVPKYHDLAPGYWQLLGEAVHYQNSQDEGFTVDLHWEIGAMMYYYRIPYAALRRDARPILYNGNNICSLSAEHLLIHLCLNAYKDSICAARKVLDLMLLLAHLKLDWRQVMREAVAFGCQRPLYLTLREVAHLAPKLVPPSALLELARYRPSFTELVVLHGRLRYLTLGLPSFWRHRSFRDWAYVVRATLWPAPDYLLVAYGNLDRVNHLKCLIARNLGCS